MKILFSALFLFALSTGAFAQRIETQIEGRTYSCVPLTDPAHPTNSFACVEMAYNGPYTRTEAMELCENAHGTAPAECALKAYSGPYTKDEAFAMCSKALSAGPAECALKAYAGPFTKDEAKVLCSFPTATIATADCALQAYATIYTREEALKVCAHTKPKSRPARLSKADFETLVIEANEKAVRENEYKK